MNKSKISFNGKTSNGQQPVVNENHLTEIKNRTYRIASHAYAAFGSFYLKDEKQINEWKEKFRNEINELIKFIDEKNNIE
ncbi:MAG: hypothetical protein HY841_11860 [Bacteroidetes bacterium]|nr:hypothetical protein [Bacteroidota bacterium]